MVNGIKGLDCVKCFIGVTLYLAIWALTPPAPDAPSLLDRVVAAASELFDRQPDDELDAIDRDSHFR